MSKERELLKEFIDFVDSYEFYPTERNIIWEIVSRTQELLAQPEHIPDVGNMVEPVAWGVYDPNEDMLVTIYGYKERPNMELKERFEWVKLYTAPPKRKPLTTKLISLGNNCHESFIKGVRFAEEMQHWSRW